MTYENPLPQKAMVDWRSFDVGALFVRCLLIATVATGIVWASLYGISELHQSDPGQQ